MLTVNNKATLIIRAALAVLGAAPILLTIFLLSGQLSPSTIPIITTGPTPVLTEFGDFSCPHCANFAFTIMPEIQKEFIDPGLISFEYRHYPFLGDQSSRAAEASECAREQDAFMAYHYRLFAMLLSDKPYTFHTLTQAAEDTGIDAAALAACIDNNTYKTKVSDDFEFAKTLGVKGTPSLFINNTYLRWSDRQDLIDQLRAFTAPSPGSPRTNTPKANSRKANSRKEQE